MKKLTVILATLFLSGCGLQWVNTTNPYANYQQDEFACRSDALRLIPNVVVPPQPQQAPSYNTNCTRFGNSVNCNSTAMPSTDTTAVAQSFQNMTTSNARASHVGSCMRAKGWYLEKKS